MRQGHKYTAQLALAGVFGLLLAPVTHAAQWDKGAGVSLGGIYTDNVCLSKDNEEDQWIGTATPDVRVSGQGARASMDLFAALEFNTLSDNSTDCNNRNNRKNPTPRARFNGNAELKENWVYFSSSAYVDQNKVNPFRSGGGEGIDGSGNTNTTYRYSLNPYINRRISSTTNLYLGYTFDEVINSVDRVGDSTGNRVTLDVGSSPELSRFSAGIVGDYSKIDYDATRNRPSFDSELGSARLRSAYQVNSEWQFNGFIGRDWNDFVSNDDDIDGFFWDVGAQWTPSERIVFGAGYGDRFFGNTPRFNFSYRHKRSQIDANYEKVLTYDRNLRTFNEGVDDFGDLSPVFDPDTGELLGFISTPTTTSTSPIVDERFTLNYRFNGRRTTISLYSSYTQQKRTEDQRDSDFTTIGVNYLRQLSSQLTWTVGLSWRDREAEPEPGDNELVNNSDTTRFTTGFNRKIGENLTVSLRYQFSTRNSEFSQDEYDENRVRLRIRYRF